MVLGTVSAAALTLSASAADIYRGPEGPGGFKDGPYAPSWAGFYGGVNGGFGWESSDANLSGATFPVQICGVGGCPPPIPPIPFANKSGPGLGFAGGQMGYNFQRSNVVFGVEADIQGSAVQDSVTVASNGIDTATASSELNWFGTLRGRIGYGFDRSLVYFTGGLAFGGVKDTLSTTFSKTLVFDGTKTGYTLGGGVEYLLAPSWSVKAEYQYLDLGGDTLSFTKINGTATFTDPHTYNTVRAGLNYHLGGGYEPLK
jgi:outer membrane immunogenic protein